MISYNETPMSFGVLPNIDLKFGEASESRDSEQELYFKVDFCRYSSLNKVDTSLEQLMA